MIQIMTREWEVTKHYIFEVVLKDGLIRLDWDDFEVRAQDGWPFVAVKIDEPSDVSELTAKAIGEVCRNVKGQLFSLMVILSFRKDKDLMMDEIGRVCDCLSCLADEQVDIVYGVRQADEISGDRCVTVFAFEKGREI